MTVLTERRYMSIVTTATVNAVSAAGIVVVSHGTLTTTAMLAALAGFIVTAGWPAIRRLIR